MYMQLSIQYQCPITETEIKVIFDYQPADLENDCGEDIILITEVKDKLHCLEFIAENSDLWRKPNGHFYKQDEDELF